MKGGSRPAGAVELMPCLLITTCRGCTTLTRSSRCRGSVAGLELCGSCDLASLAAQSRSGRWHSAASGHSQRLEARHYRLRSALECTLLEWNKCLASSGAHSLIKITVLTAEMETGAGCWAFVASSAARNS